LKFDPMRWILVIGADCERSHAHYGKLTKEPLTYAEIFLIFGGSVPSPEFTGIVEDYFRVMTNSSCLPLLVDMEAPTNMWTTILCHLAFFFNFRC
jgi:hypothetical protein